MRTRVWCMSLVLAVLGVACGDQPTEVVPEQQMTQGRGMMVAATSSSDDGLSITTDKDDYQPGDTVWFTGAGWPANDTLDILLEDEPATHEPHTWWVPVEEDGTFLDSTYIVDIGDLGVTFTLTATSRGTGRWLSVQFTDNEQNIQMPTAAPTPFSPNQASSAGVKDKTIITVDNGPGQAANVSIRIRAGTAIGGDLLRTLDAVTYSSNQDLNHDWDGKNGVGAFVTDGSYTARLVTVNGQTVTEHDIATRKRTVVVDNTNPTVGVNAIPGGTDDVQMTITGTAGDANGLEKVEVTVLKADNTVLASGNATTTDGFATWSFTYTPTQTGAQKARAKATDNAGNNTTTADVAFTVVANNSPPTANAGGPYQGNEGDLIPLNGSLSSDPDGDDLTYLWSVDVEATTPFVRIDVGGECTFVDPSDATNADADELEDPSLKCTDDGVFKLTLVVTDEHNAASAPALATVTVKNVKPTVTVSPATKSIAEGGSATFTATVEDAGANDKPADFDFAWTTTVSPCSPSGTPTITSVTYGCNDNGSGTVKLSVDDKDEDGPASDEATLTVTNVAPTASGVTTNGPVPEGTDIEFSLADVFDPSTVDRLTLKYAFYCGVGDASAYQSTTYATAGTANEAECPTTDNGTRTVKGRVFDKDGGSTEYSQAVTVTNVPPTITSILTPDGDALPDTIFVNGTVEMEVQFGDPGTGDTHKAQVKCSPDDLDYTDVGGSGNDTSPFTTSCTFTSIGKKTIYVKVTDDDGEYDVETHTVVVTYDFDGFYAPVDRPNTMNVSKAGQAIPLKWRLLDAGGLPVLNLTAVAVKAVSISCAGHGTTTDQIEEYAAGSSGLQNLGGGYYQFNWKTPTSYANSCKNIALTFGADPLSYTEEPSALFSFKK